MSRTIVISVNTAWNIYNFRAGLIKAMLDHGYDVVAVAPKDAYVDKLKQMGCRFIALAMDNNGTNPSRDLALLRGYYRILQAERPLALCSYTVKPNVYGSLAASALGIPVINNIAGLGTTFINRTLISHVVRLLYKVSLRRSSRIFFQNQEDRALFIRAGMSPSHLTDCLPGSGMNLDQFQPAMLPDDEHPDFRFLLVARLLKDKGVMEFAEASRRVRREFPYAKFQVLGGYDPANSNAIPKATLQEWSSEGIIEHLGQVDNVRPYIAAAHCVVLPSYREGVPRSLLEGAAMSRPLIAADTVGCREVVDHEINGLLCKVRDSADLAEKMREMICLPLARRLEMGMAGRRKIEAQFDEKIVIKKYMDQIAMIESGKLEKPCVTLKSGLQMDR